MTARRTVVGLLTVCLLWPVQMGFVPPVQARGGRVFGGLLGGLAAGLIVRGELRRQRRQADADAAAAAAAAAYGPPVYYAPPPRPVYAYDGYYPVQPVYQRRVVYREVVREPVVVREVHPSCYYTESY